MNGLELLSSVDKLPDTCDPSTVLATLEGPFADYSVPTGNGYWYSAELYDKILQSSNWSEFSSNNVNFAEGDHPAPSEDRSALYLPKVSHAYRDVVNDKERQRVMGKVDILDTPHGRILYTLVKYGARLGVSSRGEGDLIIRNPSGGKYKVLEKDDGSVVKVDVYGNEHSITTEDKIEVDPDTYVFYAWDIVHQPSNKAARLDLLVDRKDAKSKSIVSESVHKSSLIPLFESIKDNKQALQEVESVISQSDIEDKSQLTTKLKEYVDMLNGPTSDTRDEVIAQLKQDIEELSSRYIKLETAYNTLNSNTNLRNINDTVNKVLDKVNQTNKFKGANQLIESIADDLLARIEEVYTNLIEPLYEIKKNLARLVISHQDERSIAEQYYNRIITSNQGILHSIQEIPALGAPVQVDESSITYLSQQLSDSLSKLSQLELDNAKLSESNKSLRAKLKEAQSASQSRNKDNQQYLEFRCSQLGLDGNQVKTQLPRLNSMTLSEIDSALSSIYGQKVTQVGDLITPEPDELTSQRLVDSINYKVTSTSRNESLMRVIAGNAD